MIDDDDDEDKIKEKFAQHHKPVLNNHLEKSSDKKEIKNKMNNNNLKSPESKTQPNQSKIVNGNTKNTDNNKSLNNINDKKNNTSNKPKTSNTKPVEKVLNKKRKKSESSKSSESSREEHDNSDDNDSDSDSDESDSESESESDSASKSKKKKSKSKKVKKAKNNSNNNEKTKVILKTKESLVHQLLKRWWYAFSWPNKEDFSEELKSNKLRKVEVTDWRVEREVDDKGYSKCIELCGYKGVFRDSKGTLYDFRPKEMCPSFNNFMKKDEKTIYDLLLKAIKEQINALDNSEKYSNQDNKVLDYLKEELKLTLDNYNRKFK